MNLDRDFCPCAFLGLLSRWDHKLSTRASNKPRIRLTQYGVGNASDLSGAIKMFDYSYSYSVRARGSSERCRYLGRKEKTRKKYNDSGTDWKIGKRQDMEKKAKGSIEHQRAVWHQRPRD